MLVITSYRACRQFLFTALLVGLALCLHEVTVEMLISHQRIQEMEIGSMYRLLLGAKMDRLILHSIVEMTVGLRL